MILPSFGSKASTVRRSALNNGGISENFRREGSHFVRVQLDWPDIDGLIRLRLLRRAQRHDTKARQVAVRALLYRVLEGEV